MDVAAWLHGLGLQQYEQAFCENAIDDAVLLELTADDLKDLGVSLVGHRRKLLAAIAALRSESGPEPRTEARGVADTSIAERRHLTVMLCDLVGSTALSARLDPEDLRGIISDYHRCCTELVERNGGFVAKYMGDGVLAYFGYPQAHEHDAERAVRAGLNMVETVPKLDTGAGVPLQVRIGIATGLVVVGDLIGTGAAQEQAIVGETPNLAARLQALAEPGAVVIAAATRRLTGGLFDYRDLGKTALKGFAENVPAWQVLGASAIESRFEAMRTAMTPLVGRNEEIDLLLRRWEQAKEGDGQVVLISGEPGIGKSRIAETILERLSNEPHIRLRYFCSPHHQDSALYPSIAQLERAAGFRREDTADQRLDKLEAVLARGTNDLSGTVPLLAELLSVPTGDRYPPLNLTPQKRKEKTLHAQLAQVEGLATQQPVLMVWEDVHWSDPTTRESLDLLIERVPALRVLVIITFRPEFTPPWIGRPQVTLLSLNRLSSRHRAEMITYVTGGKTMPKEIADQIVGRTDGVPLFIEELTKAVVESGVVAEAGDHYEVSGPLTPLAIPTSLHASLLARLDRLAPVREVAQIAAALARQFSHELISAVAGMPQQQLDNALHQLVSAELMFRRGTPPDAEYTFKHALVQDAAYSTLLKSRRQQIHRKIATILEEKFPDIMTAQPALLAHHCTEAGLIEQAVEYWLKAGQHSVARSAITEAVAQLEKGLELVQTLAPGPQCLRKELALQSALGGALSASKGAGALQTGAAYIRARELCEEYGDPSLLFPVLSGLSTYHVARNELIPARDVANGLLRLAQARGDREMHLVSNRAMGTCLCHLGEFAMSVDHLERALSYYDAKMHKALASVAAYDARVSALNWLAIDLFVLGQPDQAASRVRESVSWSRELRHPHSLCFSLALAAIVSLLRWTDHGVIKLLTELDAIATGQRFPYWVATAQIIRGHMVSNGGNAVKGLELIHKGLSEFKTIGSAWMQTYFFSLLAQSFEQAGQAKEALAILTTALETTQSTGESWYVSELHRARGEWFLAYRSEEVASAELCFASALSIATQHNAKMWELRAATSLARLWRDQGKRTEARDLLAPIYGWFTEGLDTPVLQNAKALLDQLG